MRRTGLWPLVLLCFVLSGATGLVYEVAWTRSLTLVFGTTSFAVSTTLAGFMAGLGGGALLFGKLVDRWGRPLRVYALLELGIGAWALAFPALLAWLVPLYQAAWEGYRFSVLPLRVGLLLPALLVPTALMGGTLPALMRHFEGRTEGLGGRAGLLYGLNTLGAVLGAGATGFGLLPRLGLSSTTALAATLNLAIGVVALWLSWPESGRARPPGPPHRDAVVRPRDAGLLVVFAVSGFVALLSESAWTRGLTLVLGSSTYAFTIMLATFLTGLSAGSLLMARVVARDPDLLRVLGSLQAAIGIASLAAAHLFGELPLLYLHLFKAVSGATALLVGGQFVLAALIMLVPALLMGAVFPVVVQGLAGRGAGELVGRAYAANTAGAVLGALLGGFVLIPAAGIANTLILGAGLSLAIAFGVFAGSRRHWRAASVTAVLLLALPALAPRWEALVMSSGVYKEAPLYLSLYPGPGAVFRRLLPQFRLLFYREGPTATVVVTERPSLEDHRHLALAIDGKVDASTAGDMPTQILSGHLPLLLHSPAEKVLVVGVASGVTLGAVTRHPVRQVTAVEIEPAVVAASRLFEGFNHRPLDDPRVRLVVEDARTLLLLSRDRYDVIISEPSNPWMSGPARLFTREFFELGRARLEPGGLFVQWLQLYGMTQDSLKALLRTFQRVFPHVLLFQTAPGDLLLAGAPDPLAMPVDQAREKMRAPGVAADLARVGVRDVLDLLVRFRLGDREVRAYAGDGPLNTDDNALIEFSAPWQIHLDTGVENAAALARAGRGVAGYLQEDRSSALERARFLFALAARALVVRDWAQAETVAREGLALAASAEGLWVLGEALARQGRTAEASSLWHKALVTDPGHRGTRLSLALYHDERGETFEAARQLAPVGARFRDDAAVQFLLGVNRYRAGLYRQAAAFLSRAAALRAGPSTADDWARIHFGQGDLGIGPLALYYLQLTHGKLGNQRAAAEAWAGFLAGLDRWRRGLERQPPDPSSFSLIERIGLRPAPGVRLAEGSHLSHVLARAVIEPLTYYYKGVTAYVTGYPEVASTELETALARLGGAGGEASRSRARYYLGLAYWKLGRLPQARFHLAGFVEHLEAEDRQSFAATEAARALASIGEAQGQRGRPAGLEPGVTVPEVEIRATPGKG